MAPPLPRITRREAQVLAAIRAHLSNAEIAEKLCLSVRTVESHVSSLLRKTGVADRRSLARHVPPPANAAFVGLPSPRTALIGRARELDLVLGIVEQARLVSITGPGGVGKTRLAVAVAGAAAASHPAGGAFVDLVPVRDTFVAQAVAAALDVTETPGQSLEASVIQRLGATRTLLVLDNCEHVLDDAARFVDRVLSHCPHTTVLTTSRQRLGVPGERTVAVAPLPLASDAERLFHDRATEADPAFHAPPATVAEICARLDGMPLAIELAAARTAALGATGLLEALDDVLPLLAGGQNPDQRHRSIREVVGWSYRLLTADEQELFRRLAVFTGSFDLDAVRAVAGDRPRGTVADLLGRLVEKNLAVLHASTPTSRWRLLDTIRAFAIEQLHDAADTAEVQRRYVRWAADTAAQLEQRLTVGWQDDFDRVADDLRAALATAGHPDAVPHRLARSLGHLAFARRFFTEAVDHYQHAARLAPDAADAAADLYTASEAVYAFGHAGQAYELLLASAQRARAGRAPDAQAIALAHAAVTATRFPGGFPAEVPHEQVRRLLAEATAVGDPGEPLVAAHLAAARAWTATGATYQPDPALAEAAVDAARATGDAGLVAAALDATAAVAAQAGRLRDAHRIGAERLTLLARLDRNHPHSASEVLDVFHNSWLAAFAAGDLPAALSIAQDIHRDDVHGRHPYRATSKLVPSLVMLGRLPEALHHVDGLWRGWQQAGRPTAAWMSPGLSAVALLHGLLDDDAGHRRWRHRAEQAIGGRNPSLARNNASYAAFVEARVAVHRDDRQRAAAVVDAAFAEFPPGRNETYARAAGAELAVLAGLPDAADRLAVAAAGAAENQWAACCLLRAQGRLHGDRDALLAAVDGWERIGARFERACTLLLIPDRAAEGHAEICALRPRRAVRPHSS